MNKKKALTKAQITELKEMIQLQSKSARESSRLQAILMYEKGLDFEVIHELVGLKRSAVLKWRGWYQREGIKALHDKRKRKPKALLTKSQRVEISRVLKEEKPATYGYTAKFWTTTVLGSLIKEQYGVEYKSKRRLYLLFAEASFTYHKPGQQYRNRNQE